MEAVQATCGLLPNSLYIEAPLKVKCRPWASTMEDGDMVLGRTDGHTTHIGRSGRGHGGAPHPSGDLERDVRPDEAQSVVQEMMEIYIYLIVTLVTGPREGLDE